MDQTQPPMSGAHLTSVEELLRFSFKRATGYFSRILPALVTLFIATLVIDISGRSGQPSIASILCIVGVLAYLISLVSLLRIVADVETGTGHLADTIARSTSLIWPYVWVMILAGVIYLGSFTLFFIPGLIISIYLSQTVFVVLVEGVSGLKALIRSWHYVRSRWWAVLWRIVIITFVISALYTVLHFALNAVGLGPRLIAPHRYMTVFSADVITQIVETFILIPFVAAYSYLLYRSLKNTKSGAVGEEEEKEIRTWLTVFLAAGMSGIVIIVSILMSLGALLGFLGNIDSVACTNANNSFNCNISHAGEDMQKSGTSQKFPF